MKAKRHAILSFVFALVLFAAGLPVAAASDSEVPAGTRFLVELRDKLDARKVHTGKHFEARTLESLQASDGSVIQTGSRLRGRVSYVEETKMELQFEEINTGRGWRPIVATVSQVVGEKHVKGNTSSEGEISAKGSRGKHAAIGALIGAGAGAAIGGAKAGGTGAAIGAGAGGAGGALIGAASGGRDLVLEKGTRLELTLDRPLAIPYR